MDFKMDIFNEQLISVKKTALDIISIASILIGAIGLSVLTAIILPVFKAVAVVAVWVGVYFALRLFNVEYEYGFTNGELDIDKIYSKSFRKNVARVKMRQLEEMAPISAPGAKKLIQGMSRKEVLNCSSNANPYGTYYAIFRVSRGEKLCLLMEPNDKMLEAMRRFAPSKIKTAEPR